MTRISRVFVITFFSLFTAIGQADEPEPSASGCRTRPPTAQIPNAVNPLPATPKELEAAMKKRRQDIFFPQVTAGKSCSNIVARLAFLKHNLSVPQLNKFCNDHSCFFGNCWTEEAHTPLGRCTRDEKTLTDAIRVTEIFIENPEWLEEPYEEYLEGKKKKSKDEQMYTEKWQEHVEQWKKAKQDLKKELAELTKKPIAQPSHYTPLCTWCAPTIAAIKDRCPRCTPEHRFGAPQTTATAQGKQSQ